MTSLKNNRFEKIAISINDSIVGGLIGAGAGLIGGGIAANKLNETPARAMTTEDLVDTVSTIEQLQPGGRVFTTPDSVESDKGLKNWQKQAIKDLIQRGNNAYYMPMFDAIVGPPKLNKYFVGHEVGHRIVDKSGHGPNMLQRILLNSFGGTSDEIKAWEASPFAGDEKNEKNMSSSLAGRDAQRRMFITGAMLGALSPIAYEAFKHAMRLK